MNTAISSRDERAFSAPALLVAGAFFMEFSRRDGDRHRPARYGEGFWRHRGRTEYRHQRLSDYPCGPDPGQRLESPNRFGARAIFTLALAIFTLASVFCGLSTEVHIFVAMRILQGVGGALMVPVGRLAVLRTTPKHQLIKAIATLTWPGAGGPPLSARLWAAL